MVSSVEGKLKAFVGHRWVVFVCAMWDMSFAGTAYMFGSISPVIKSSMGFNQKQVAFLSVAKDLGDNVGLLAGKISEAWPVWRVILVGVVQNVVGYGLVWLVVTHRFPSLPLWAVSSSYSITQTNSIFNFFIFCALLLSSLISPSPCFYLKIHTKFTWYTP